MLQLFSGGSVHVERSNGFAPLRWIKRPTDPHNHQGKPAKHLNCLSKTPKEESPKKGHPLINPSTKPNLHLTRRFQGVSQSNTTNHHPPLTPHPQTGSPTAQKPAPQIDPAYPLPPHQHNSSLNLETRHPTYHHDKPESSRTQSDRHPSRTASTRGHSTRRVSGEAPIFPSARSSLSKEKAGGGGGGATHENGGEEHA